MCHYNETKRAGEGSTVKVLLPLISNLLWQQRRRWFLLEWNGRESV